MIGVSINPTTLTVGKTGRLDRHAATVVGRAVLQSADRYRWHEYYVQLDDGRLVILVYEGGEWKWFEAFTPPNAFTAREAETYRIGKVVELRDNAAEIKYVSTSRVVYAEGKTWDGVRKGAEARYFNAEAGNKMFVVSWTGNDIEFFTGKKLSRYMVPQAFKLSATGFWRNLLWGGSGSLDFNFKLGPALVVIVVFAAFLIDVINSPPGPVSSSVEPPPIAAAPSLQLPDGAQGTLDGEHFSIRGHTLVEIDEVGKRFRRYEYDLVDDAGDRALLIEDLDGNPHHWVLLRPATAPAWLTPTAAATLRERTSLSLGNRTASVERLLLTRSLGGSGPVAELNPPGTIRYGLLAQSAGTWMLVRWDDRQLDFEQGPTLPEKLVLDALAPAAGQ